MSSNKQMKAELGSIIRNKAVIIPVIAVMLVPLLYSVLFLGAFWDPYEKLDQVPVAIVNEDTGAELDGEQVVVGNQFVDKLKESNVFEWHFITKDEALEGLENNKYYMMIEIPASFSKDAVSLTSDEPKAAQLLFTPNEGYNFLGAQIGSSAVKEMTASLNKQLTETYVSTIYDKIGSNLEGLEAASEGAFQIAKGSQSAAEGAAVLETGLGKLNEGTVSLQEGAGKLSSASSQLKAGIQELGNGGQALSNGLEQLLAANQSLQGGMNELASNYESINGGLIALSDGTTELKQGALQLQDGLAQLAAQNSELAKSESFQALIQGSKQLAEGLKAQEAGQSTLISGSTQYKQGLATLQGGSNQFQGKLSEAAAAAGQLASGANQAGTGAEQLAAGIEKLDQSTRALVTGSKELKTGAHQLHEALLTITEGSNTLSAKLGNASDQSLNLTLTDEMKEQFAQPVELATTPFAKVPNYGTGFTPYFLSLGLYVGSMLLTIVYSMREPALKPKNAISWYGGKTVTVLLISIIQALIASTALLFILDLDIINLTGYFLFSLLVSAAFMVLIQFLCVSMGNVGRFIAIVLLILQLTSSAGTFPLELVPNWLQAINPLLPMTYSVAGFKQVISSNNMLLMWQSVWPLLIYTVGCSLLTYVYMKVAFQKNHVPNEA